MSHKTNIETLSEVIETTILGKEFKNSLIYILVKVGMQDVTPDEKDLLLSKYIYEYKDFLVQTDVFQQIQNLEDRISLIQNLSSRALDLNGPRTQSLRTKLDNQITTLSNEITQHVKRHTDNIPLPMVAKGYSDTTQGSYYGMYTFQIIKEIFRYLFGVHSNVVNNQNPVFIGGEKLVNAWQNEFLTSNNQYFLPDVLLLGHLSRWEQSSDLVNPIISKESKRAIHSYKDIIPNITEMTLVTKKREELDPKILRLLELYEEEREIPPSNEIVGYLFTPFWFFIYGKIFQDVAGCDHTKTMEYFGQVAGNIFVSTTISDMSEERATSEQDKSQKLTSIMGAYLLVNTFFDVDKILSLDLDKAPLRKIGKMFTLKSLLHCLSNVFLKEAFPQNTSKIRNEDILHVLEFIFSSEAARLYTFSSYRVNPVEGRVKLIYPERNMIIENFNQTLLGIFQEFDKSGSLQEHIMKNRPRGRGPLSSLDIPIPMKKK